MALENSNLTKKQVIAGLGGALVVIYLMARCSGPSAPPTPPSPPLDAGVRQSELAVMITNNEAQPWRECKLTLNSDWVIEGIALEPGQTVNFPLREFTKRDGARFNPAATKPKRFLILCVKAPEQLRTNVFGWD